MKTIVLKLQDKTDYESHPRQLILKLLRQLNVLEKQDKFCPICTNAEKRREKGRARKRGEKVSIFSPWSRPWPWPRSSCLYFKSEIYSIHLIYIESKFNKLSLCIDINLNIVLLYSFIFI